MHEPGQEASAGALRAHGMLALLTLVYALNFVDRQILAILLDPIRADLGASDAEMGLLTGTAFALFYTLAGVPIARLADRGSRRTILAAGLALWSALTALSGLARSFAELAALRAGVGIGEASCVPASHALIADAYPPRRRATALAIFSSGIYLGSFAAYGAGGWLEARIGWRNTLIAVGLPGLALAVAVRALGLERRDARDAPAREPGGDVLRRVIASRAFVHVALGSGVKSIAGYALLTFAPAFLERVHGMPRSEAGASLGAIIGLGGAAGTFLGGWCADRLAHRDERWRMWLAALATLAALPFVYVFLFAADATVALAAYFPASILAAVYLAPAFALPQALARSGERATAAAVLLLAINLIGLGIGPPLAGWISDALAPPLGADSIRWALAVVALSHVWGALHMFRASRAFDRDRAGP
jgi:predicted MFS family arabinose efflux permease